MNFHKSFLTLPVVISTAIVVLSVAPQANASDAIVRDYQTPRMMGMGGLKITTGLYEENFAGNPARASANPTWKVQLMDLGFEFNGDSVSKVGDIAAGLSDSEALGDTLSKIPGTSIYLKNSNSFLGVYIPTSVIDVAFAMQTMEQFDAAVHRNYSIEPGFTVVAGPSLTVSRKFLSDQALAVGTTLHYRYRAHSSSQVTLQDLLSGGELSLLDQTGDGSAFDADLGATYELPFTWLDFHFQTGLAINNLLDAGYDSGLQFISSGSGASAGAGHANRQFGLGISANRKEVWKFRDALIGIEFSDLGNNGAGSLVRTVHLGSEIGWKVFTFRLGLNQGYISAGLGLDLKVVQLDVATYGEEMTLDVGGQENRVTALRLGFQI